MPARERLIPYDLTHVWNLRNKHMNKEKKRSLKKMNKSFLQKKFFIYELSLQMDDLFIANKGFFIPSLKWKLTI